MTLASSASSPPNARDPARAQQALRELTSRSAPPRTFSEPSRNLLVGAWLASANRLVSARAASPAAAAASDAVGGVDPNNKVPAELTRRYQVFVLPRVKDKSVPLRQVKAKHIGSLLTLKGIVTRVSEVKAQICVATYTCETGGWETYQEVNDRIFMPLFTCPATKASR